jgi:hypothetical protein
MGMASGAQPLPYGYAAGAAVDIEGLVVRIVAQRYSVGKLLTLVQSSSRTISSS